MAQAEVTPDELRGRLAGGENLFVLDVREPDEVQRWAFPGAINIPLGDLGPRAEEVPTDRAVIVLCHSGVRSAAAAEVLTNGGWSAENLVGGVVAWVESEPTP